MGRINLMKVVAGGLLAGVVINVSEFVLTGVVLAADMQAAIKQLNLPPIGVSALAVFVFLGFLLGIATVWLYAAIRPRYGAGPKTALCAGSAVWFLAYAYPSAGFQAMGLFPTRLLLIGVVWGLVELLVAAVAGAWLYREEAAAGAAVR